MRPRAKVANTASALVADDEGLEENTRYTPRWKDWSGAGTTERGLRTAAVHVPDQLVAVTQHQTLQSLSHVPATTVEQPARRRWTRPRRKLLEGLVSRPPLLLPAYDAIFALVSVCQHRILKLSNHAERPDVPEQCQQHGVQVRRPVLCKVHRSSWPKARAAARSSAPGRARDRRALLGDNNYRAVSTMK